MGGAGKTGSWEPGGCIKGIQCALPCCPSVSEGAGVSANSFLGHVPPTHLPSSWSGLLEATPSSPHGLWLFQTALDSLLPCLLAPGSLFPCLGSMVLVEFQLCHLHCYLECFLCSALCLHKALPSSPPSPNCFPRDEWGDSSGLKHPCKEGWYYLVGDTSRLLLIS